MFLTLLRKWYDIAHGYMCENVQKRFSENNFICFFEQWILKLKFFKANFQAISEHKYNFPNKVKNIKQRILLSQVPSKL